jgi:tetratricopeptide (TPR) repeat protein
MRRHLVTLCAAVLLLFATCALAETTRYDSGGSELDLQRLDDARRAAYHGRYTQAIDIATQVIAHAPNFAGAYFDRALYYADAGRYDQARADLDQLSAFHPDASQIYILRGSMALREHNATRGLAELAKAAKMPAMTFWKQTHEGSGNPLEGGYYHVQTEHTISYIWAYDSIGQQMLGHDDAALDALDQAMVFETEHPEHVLAQHCWVAAVAGLLQMAELTCTTAIQKQSHDIGDYDSLGLVHLKMKAWDKAIADYNRALYTTPDMTLSLYGRGVARCARGDIAGGRADIAAARAGEPDIANIMARLGVPPPA